MADQLTVTVQFSEDGTLYYVPSMAAKHAWLSVKRYEDRAAVPASVMPFSGLCRCAAGYYRTFLNQSYFAVRLGKSEPRAAGDPMVMDYRDAKAETPAVAQAKQVSPRARGGRK